MIASLAFAVIGLAAGYLLALRLRPRPARAEGTASACVTVEPTGVRFSWHLPGKGDAEILVSPEDMDRVCRHWTARRGK